MCRSRRSAAWATICGRRRRDPVDAAAAGRGGAAVSGGGLRLPVRGELRRRCLRHGPRERADAPLSGGAGPAHGGQDLPGTGGSPLFHSAGGRARGAGGRRPGTVRYQRRGAAGSGGPGPDSGGGLRLFGQLPAALLPGEHPRRLAAGVCRRQPPGGAPPAAGAKQPAAGAGSASGVSGLLLAPGGIDRPARAPGLGAAGPIRGRRLPRAENAFDGDPLQHGDDPGGLPPGGPGAPAPGGIHPPGGGQDAGTGAGYVGAGPLRRPGPLPAGAGGGGFQRRGGYGGPGLRGRGLRGGARADYGGGGGRGGPRRRQAGRPGAPHSAGQRGEVQPARRNRVCQPCGGPGAVRPVVRVQPQRTHL